MCHTFDKKESSCRKWFSTFVSYDVDVHFYIFVVVLAFLLLCHIAAVATTIKDFRFRCHCYVVPNLSSNCRKKNEEGTQKSKEKYFVMLEALDTEIYLLYSLEFGQIINLSPLKKPLSLK